MTVTQSGPPQSASQAEEEAKALRKWQLKLLPLMVRTLFATGIFFFAASLGQVIYLHWRIEQTIPLDMSKPEQLLVAPAASEDDRRANALLLARTLLEADAIQRRHHQARVLLMARTWTVYLGFVTGMSLALVGASLILGRVQSSSTNARLEAATMKASIDATAPGLILVFFGVTLMVVTVLVNHVITVEDRSVFLPQMRTETDQAASEKKPPPRFPSPPSSTTVPLR